VPIFDYTCKGCGATFEALVLKGAEPKCASCGGTDLERLFSAAAVKSSTTADLSARSAKKRDQAQATERMHAQLQYERSHDRHG